MNRVNGSATMFLCEKAQTAALSARSSATGRASATPTSSRPARGTYCVIVEWDEMQSLAAGRPQMLATLDIFRDTPEDLGGGLVTDPVSGSWVLELLHKLSLFGLESDLDLLIGTRCCKELCIRTRESSDLLDGLKPWLALGFLGAIAGI